MAWTVKSGVPEYVSWLESARVAILGTDYEWVGEYFWLLSERTLATAPFCALGPVVCSDLSPLDFLGLVGAGRLGGGIQAASLGEKLQCFLQQKMFEAYCENVVTTTGWIDWSAGTGSISANGTCFSCVGWHSSIPVPSYATGLRIRLTSSTGSPGISWMMNVSPIAYGVQIDYSGVAGWLDTNASNSSGTTGVWHEHNTFAENAWFSPGNGPWVNIAVNGGGVASYGFEMQIKVPSGTGVDYTAPPLERPPYALTPPSGTYDDVADLGQELDNIERKLHVIIEQGITTQIDTSWPLAIEGDVLPVVSDSDVELIDVAGVIVTLNNIGNQVDEHFGEPRELHRVGRIVFGTSAGWLAPIEITVTPQLFVGLPAGVTRVRLHLLPPTTGTMQMVKRATPTG